MPATKILNISKSDTFEEVFGLFQNAEAKEVILIIPKGSKLAKQEVHFTVLKKEADNSSKLISIMTEDPVVEDFAQLCGIQVLSGSSSTKSNSKNRKSKSSESIVEVPQQESIETEVESEYKDEYQEEEAVIPEAVFAAAPIRSSRRTLNDIVKEETENTIPIKEDKKTFRVGIRKEQLPTTKSDTEIDQLETMWANQRDTEEYSKRIDTKSKSLPLFGRIFKRRKTSSPRIKSFKKWPIFAIGIAVIIFGLLAYANMGSAKITVQAKKNNVDFKLKVVASPNFSSVDISSGQIPGQQFSIEKEVSDTFPASGEKTVAQKSHGQIQIFNNSIGKPQRLVATTRFQSQGGLIFRIPVTITVPGATKTSDGKIAPGSIKSDVYADKAGPEYNIGPSSFTVPGFKDLPQYTQFSGLSTSAMTGGIIGPSKVVTEEDFTKAQQQLEQKLKDEVSAGLKDKILDLKVLGQDQIKIESPIVNARVGEAASELKMTLKGSITTVAFREADVFTLISDYLKNNGGFDLSRSKLTEEYQDKNFDSGSSKMSFTVHANGIASANINQDKTMSDILGMNQEAIKSYFNSLPEVDSVKIILSPLWVRSVPQNSAKVKLTVE